ncbi:MAG: uroporphyrinogen-III synthase [Simkania sp.]|nr:uroporphyrinogen-III synthase [Simkania sp.]
MRPKKILYLGSNPHWIAKDNVEVVHLQLFDIVPRSWYLPSIAVALTDWTQYTHMIFTSKHAVKILQDILPYYQLLIPQNTQRIAVGQTTAKVLEQNGWGTPWIAREERQEGIIQLLRTIEWNEDSYVLFPRSALSRGGIEQFFLERMIRYQICDLYDTYPRRIEPFPDLEEFDEILFTSPSTVAAFFSQVQTLPKRPCLRAIGEVTWQNLVRATMICTTLLH